MTKIPRFWIDTNEFLIPGYVYLLSRDDVRMDDHDRPVRLEAGMRVEVYDDDIDENGAPDPLVGYGVVIPTPLEDAPASWSHVKWSCELSPPGLRHQSDLDQQA